MPIKSKYNRVYIEITNVCNLSCEFCPAGNNIYKPRTAVYMTPQEFEHIIIQVRPIANEIYLHVTGEPLMHPDLEDLLFICEKYNMCVNITTNAFLLINVEKILINAKMLRTINISLHSFSSNLLNNEEDLEEYINNIIRFIRKLLIYSSATCKLRIWNMEQGLFRAYVFTRLEEEFNLPFKLTSRMTQLEGIRLVRRVFLSQSEQFIWPSLSSDEYPGNAFCLGLRSQFAILADGKVVPCCLDGEGIMELGNIFQSKLDEILSSEKALNIYNGFSKRKAAEELCRKCGYRLRFN